MATWVEDIVKALSNLGGIAPLSAIYAEVRKVRPAPHPPSLEATVRNSIESHSSDSKNFRGKDLFFSAKGVGSGIWGLRSAAEHTPEAVDLDLPPGMEEPGRVQQKIYRILRDTELARQIKLLHKHTCQICGCSIDLPTGERYSEAHHIKPLGSPHFGPDVAENIIVLCPNHHVMLDYGVIPLEPTQIRNHPNHAISAQFIAYHNNRVHGQVANEAFSGKQSHGAAQRNKCHIVEIE